MAVKEIVKEKNTKAGITFLNKKYNEQMSKTIDVSSNWCQYITPYHYVMLCVLDRYHYVMPFH